MKPSCCTCRSLIKSKIMPDLVESEEEEEDDTEIKDPLPEKLQNSMVTKDDFVEINSCSSVLFAEVAKVI